MEIKMSDQAIPTEIEGFKKLVEKRLIIPSYQRPYTWNYKNIDKMIEDFNEFLESNNQEYYMGSVLLHKEKDEYNIIDGQQRITSLIILSLALKLDDYKNDIKYKNLISKKRIKENYDYLQNMAFNDKLKEIFEKICFTVIVTENVDDAFTFFDTQNSRGVQPSVLVLLKAFNLRCISSNEVQKKSAKEWDNHERHDDYHLAEKSEKLEWLIKIFFYRVRNWRGNQKADFGNYDNFRDYFTKWMRKPTNQGYQLFTSIKNKKVITDEYETIIKAKNFDWFDFSVRQPIYQGEGFFHYLNHYSNLLDELMKIEVNNGKNFESLLKVHRVGSVYMESFLAMITLVYYDRFGKENILEFIKVINDILVDIRLTSSRILKQSLEIQFIRSENFYIKQNILDFLSSAFDSQEVLEWLNKSKKTNEKKLSGVRKKFSEKNEEFWRVN